MCNVQYYLQATIAIALYLLMLFNMENQLSSCSLYLSKYFKDVKVKSVLDADCPSKLNSYFNI